MKTEASEYLSLLQEIQNNNVSTFTVMPADEPRFTIETNSRNIIVPSEFSFLSVQNDHRAETIYFEIDRYFDNVDLSQHTCVVQFINKSGTTINEGTYPVTSMDIDSVDGKMVFGWDIRNDATQLTGDITFSVRFYSIDNNGNFTYNFNTLTASSYILPSLNIIASGERITATELEVWTDKMNNLASSIESDIITVEEKIEELENYIASIPEDYTALTEEVSQLSGEIEKQGEVLSNYYGVIPASVNKYEVATEHGLMGYADGKFNPSEVFRSTRFLPIKPNQQYVIGTASSASAVLVSMSVSAIVFYDANKSYISGLQNVSSFTTPENAVYYRCSIYYSGTEANIVQINRCQIEEGNTLTSFEEYKEESGYIYEPYAENIFEFLPVKEAIRNGYVADNGLFFENDSYESVLIEVTEKEVYFINSYSNGASNMPIAYAYDETMKRLPYGEKINVSRPNIDVRYEVPKGARYIAVNSYKNNGISCLSVKKAHVIGSSNLPLKNKSFIALGDSIVAQNVSWRDTFIAKTGAKQVLCTAVAGAHLCDYSDTVLNGTDFAEHGNTVCNQVQAILNNPPTENIDFFMICAGTNDTGFSAEQLKTKDVSQFYSANQPIDIDTVDRTVIDGAMRWIAEKLWSIQPDAIIFFATPIQAYQGIRTSWYLKLFSEYMETVGAYLATPIIPAFSESGIYSAFENNNANGKYLIDGLHPNPDGKVKLGNYYANAVAKYFTY